MIQLNFIEFQPAENYNAGITYLDQLDYAKKDIVLFSAAISYEDDRIGYIAILPFESDTDAYAGQAPVVQKGTHTYTIRGWWTTDQTFCPDESKKIN